jgi:hypothetical protein
MYVAMHPHAALALLSLALTACASSPPAPVEAGHPAHPNTVAAPPAALTTLEAYRDFGRADPGAVPAQPASPSEEEQHDAHEH